MINYKISRLYSYRLYKPESRILFVIGAKSGYNQHERTMIKSGYRLVIPLNPYPCKDGGTNNHITNISRRS